MINIKDLPANAQYWTVHKLIDYCMENGIEVILNNIPPKPHIEHDIMDLLDNPRTWESLCLELKNYRKYVRD
jgi:hypothetical protein